MTIDDIRFLKLDAEWMRDRYISYLENETGPAFVITDDTGKPLCAYGSAFLWPGCCEVWFNLISRDKVLSTVKAFKRTIALQAKEFNIRRMHATVKCESKVATRFIEALGFEFEGVLRKYNPDGSDAAIYARCL